MKELDEMSYITYIHTDVLCCWTLYHTTYIHCTHVDVDSDDVVLIDGTAAVAVVDDVDDDDEVATGAAALVDDDDEADEEGNNEWISWCGCMAAAAVCVIAAIGTYVFSSTRTTGVSSLMVACWCITDVATPDDVFNITAAAANVISVVVIPLTTGIDVDADDDDADEDDNDILVVDGRAGGAILWLSLLVFIGVVSLEAPYSDLTVIVSWLPWLSGSVLTVMAPSFAVDEPDDELFAPDDDDDCDCDGTDVEVDDNEELLLLLDWDDDDDDDAGNNGGNIDGLGEEEGDGDGDDDDDDDNNPANDWWCEIDDGNNPGDCNDCNDEWKAISNDWLMILLMERILNRSLVAALLNTVAIFFFTLGNWDTYQCVYKQI
jgi:hypothetical protein